MAKEGSDYFIQKVEEMKGDIMFTSYKGGVKRTEHSNVGLQMSTYAQEHIKPNGFNPVEHFMTHNNMGRIAVSNTFGCVLSCYANCLLVLLNDQIKPVLCELCDETTLDAVKARYLVSEELIEFMKLSPDEKYLLVQQKNKINFFDFQQLLSLFNQSQSGQGFGGLGSQFVKNLMMPQPLFSFNLNQELSYVRQASFGRTRTKNYVLIVDNTKILYLFNLETMQVEKKMDNCASATFNQKETFILFGHFDFQENLLILDPKTLETRNKILIKLPQEIDQAQEDVEKYRIFHLSEYCGQHMIMIATYFINQGNMDDNVGSQLVFWIGENIDDKTKWDDLKANKRIKFIQPSRDHTNDDDPPSNQVAFLTDNQANVVGTIGFNQIDNFEFFWVKNNHLEMFLENDQINYVPPKLNGRNVDNQECFSIVSGVEAFYSKVFGMEEKVNIRMSDDDIDFFYPPHVLFQSIDGDIKMFKVYNFDWKDKNLLIDPKPLPQGQNIQQQQIQAPQPSAQIQPQNQEEEKKESVSVPPLQDKKFPQPQKEEEKKISDSVQQPQSIISKPEEVKKAPEQVKIPQEQSKFLPNIPSFIQGQPPQKPKEPNIPVQNQSPPSQGFGFSLGGIKLDEDKNKPPSIFGAQPTGIQLPKPNLDLSGTDKFSIGQPKTQASTGFYVQQPIAKAPNQAQAPNLQANPPLQTGSIFGPSAFQQPSPYQTSADSKKSQQQPPQQPPSISQQQVQQNQLPSQASLGGFQSQPMFQPQPPVQPRVQQEEPNPLKEFIIKQNEMLSEAYNMLVVPNVKNTIRIMPTMQDFIRDIAKNPQYEQIVKRWTQTQPETQRKTKEDIFKMKSEEDNLKANLEYFQERFLRIQDTNNQMSKKSSFENLKKINKTFQQFLTSSQYNPEDKDVLLDIVNKSNQFINGLDYYNENFEINNSLFKKTQLEQIEIQEKYEDLIEAKQNKDTKYLYRKRDFEDKYQKQVQKHVEYLLKQMTVILKEKINQEEQRLNRQITERNLQHKLDSIKLEKHQSLFDKLDGEKSQNIEDMRQSDQSQQEKIQIQQRQKLLRLVKNTHRLNQYQGQLENLVQQQQNMINPPQGRNIEFQQRQDAQSSSQAPQATRQQQQLSNQNSEQVAKQLQQHFNQSKTTVPSKVQQFLSGQGTNLYDDVERENSFDQITALVLNGKQQQPGKASLQPGMLKKGQTQQNNVNFQGLKHSSNIQDQAQEMSSLFGSNLNEFGKGKQVGFINQAPSQLGQKKTKNLEEQKEQLQLSNDLLDEEEENENGFGLNQNQLESVSRFKKNNTSEIIMTQKSNLKRDSSVTLFDMNLSERPPHQIPSSTAQTPVGMSHFGKKNEKKESEDDIFQYALPNKDKKSQSKFLQDSMGQSDSNINPTANTLIQQARKSSTIENRALFESQLNAQLDLQQDDLTSPKDLFDKKVKPKAQQSALFGQSTSQPPQQTSQLSGQISQSQASQQKQFSSGQFGQPGISTQQQQLPTAFANQQNFGQNNMFALATLENKTFGQTDLKQIAQQIQSNSQNQTGTFGSAFLGGGQNPNQPSTFTSVSQNLHSSHPSNSFGQAQVDSFGQMQQNSFGSSLNQSQPLGFGGQNQPLGFGQQSSAFSLLGTSSYPQVSSFQGNFSKPRK